MTRSWAGKRYWLVGASAGLGRALAHELSRAGATLVLSARDDDALKALATELPGPSEVIPLDVTDGSAVQSAALWAMAAGDLDGVIYLSAVYWPMPATQWDTGRAAAMIDVNLSGVLRVLGAVLPDMVARGAGHVVLTSSLSAYRGLPGAIGYGASKAALMSLAESLHLDLRGTGVEVQLVNPGFIRTRLTDKNDFAMPFLMEPDQAARAMFRHISGSRFAANFPWVFSILFRLSRLLPEPLYLRLFAPRRARAEISPLR